MMAPLDMSRNKSATRKALATTLHDNFLSSFPHILTPNLWRPGVRFRSYITFCTCTSDRKRLKMWFCVQNQCKLRFSLSSYKYAYFCSQWLNSCVLALLCFKKCLWQISPEKTTQGDCRNVSRPLARILMEANIGHLPTKFGHNQMQGWKVINRYRILQVNFHIWPHLTFDLLMWPLTPEYHGGQYKASTNQVWLQTDGGLESYQPL